MQACSSPINLDTAQRWIAEGANVNATDVHGKSVLIHLLSSGPLNVPAVRLLVDLGADITVKDQSGMTVLMRVIERGRSSDDSTPCSAVADLAKYLIEAKRADVNYNTKDGVTALSYAGAALSYSSSSPRRCAKEILLALLNAGADVNVKAEVLKELHIKRDVIFVAAAGNDGRSGCVFPASEPAVIAVGAAVQGPNGTERAPYSNYGSYVRFVATDVALSVVKIAPMSVNDVEKLLSVSGTSFAAAHVTGVIAAYLTTHPRASDEMLNLVLPLSYVNGFGTVRLLSFR